MVTWTPAAASSSSWVSLTGGVDDWLDPRLTELLTESGLFLLAEDEDFLCIEAVASTPTSPWVAL